MKPVLDDKVHAALSQLKVFPLPAGVLRPGMGMGLHVFEPRYKVLVRDALASDGVLSVPMLAPGWEPDYHGRPLLKPLGGVGVIERHERMLDGRYNLLVRGLARIHIVDEHLQVKPYREVRAELVEETPTADALPGDTLRRMLLEVCQRIPKATAAAVAREAAKIRDPGRLCDAVAVALIDDARVLQSVLEALDVRQRVQLLVSELGHFLLKQRETSPKVLS
jgi:uncharacterized protein